MIPASRRNTEIVAHAAWPWSAGTWRRELRAAITDPDELLAAVGLERHTDLRRRLAARDFALRVPRGFVSRMRCGDPGDPLLLQVLPDPRELEAVPGFERDPLRETELLGTQGVLHKYAGRALLVVTGACAVHCRYCFRRHFPYAEHRLAGEWAVALDYLRRDRTLTEVILSGGDPLSLQDRALASLAAELEGIAHLRRLRIHTRLPVVLPERVDPELLAWLTGSRLQPVVVIHANHAREIDERVVLALELLRRGGVTLLNQTVLLRGVNDSAAALCDLSEAIFAAGVLPYYLHLLDPVAGAAHFAVPEEEAERLAEEVRERLPGYLVPRLVREVPGAGAKVALKR
jgi:EF-P beta-lysylation protein EpmB